MEPPKDEDLEEREDTDKEEEEESSSRYPGLDKRHGFFLSIANNQSDRDSYHWRKEDEKLKRKQEIDNQIKQQKEERRRKKREKQKPDRQVYRPPHTRRETTPTQINYRIEIEVRPNTYWRRDVSQLGKISELVRSATDEFRLDNSTGIVLEEVLYNFEKKLRIQQNH
ncbi:PREDICTED: protein PXR1-like [Amphimedon queenslandica]|uniref:Uncharacterized protein n=1 Tax=Amphimedon queenslandica TaxID=400682 RepID=A0AAN0JRC2_AMPQE|nr:PREDICTED: protein PXR1-like [Amphimedon queenslandica]|eukprot:XP_019859389.1 PREDICTED: protein PXR1-like [Amphimedon queenslandica]